MYLFVTISDMLFVITSFKLDIFTQQKIRIKAAINPYNIILMLLLITKDSIGVCIYSIQLYV
jgi:hypothetical protein